MPSANDVTDRNVITLHVFVTEPCREPRRLVRVDGLSRSHMALLLRFSPQSLLSLLFCVCLLLSPLPRASAQCNPMLNLLAEPNTFPFVADGNTRLVRSDVAAGPSIQSNPAGTLALVDAGGFNSASAAWMSQPFRATDGFQATFTFRMQQADLDGFPASPDGFAFVLQPAKANSTSALGGVSNQMGYGGLSGIAVEFDTFDSSGHSNIQTSQRAGWRCAVARCFCSHPSLSSVAGSCVSQDWSGRPRH